MPIVIIIGASSGIGRAAAVRIAQSGAGVIATYNQNRQGGLDTVASIEAAGGTAIALPLDIADSESFSGFRAGVERAIEQTWGADRITGLVNNAGFGQMASFEETTEELFEHFFRVILRGPYFLTQALLPLLDDGAAIVNTSSNSAQAGIEAGYSAYASMKGGLNVLTRYLAKELSDRGIRVNSVAPGPTRTRIAGDSFEKYPEVIPPLAARTALGRLGEPDDIADVIAFLLSDQARWVTAENIEVSGGFDL